MVWFWSHILQIQHINIVKFLLLVAECEIPKQPERLYLKYELVHWYKMFTKSFNVLLKRPQRCGVLYPVVWGL